jgi:hypothetical protein
MLSNDHLLNWPINNVPDYTVGIGEEPVGPADWFDEWLALPKFTAGRAEVLGYAPTLAWRTGTGIVDWPRIA